MRWVTSSAITRSHGLGTPDVGLQLPGGYAHLFGQAELRRPRPTAA
ncbi:hypothetical protein SAVIM338S_07166 [Streptomyces avidinii]